MMAPVSDLVRNGIPPSFEWPVKFCVATTTVAYVLSMMTGNVSQVDRVWTFLPTIYTAYFALLPLWPQVAPMPLWPYTPEVVHRSVSERYTPRALLMLALVVCLPSFYVFALLIEYSLQDHLDVPVCNSITCVFLLADVGLPVCPITPGDGDYSICEQTPLICSIHLTINSHDEDYRWQIVRSKVPAWLFQVFNLVFIGTSSPVLALGFRITFFV